MKKAVMMVCFALAAAFGCGAPSPEEGGEDYAATPAEEDFAVVEEALNASAACLELKEMVADLPKPKKYKNKKCEANGIQLELTHGQAYQRMSLTCSGIDEQSNALKELATCNRCLSEYNYYNLYCTTYN